MFQKYFLLLLLSLIHISSKAQDFSHELIQIILQKSEIQIEMYENYFNLIGDINEDNSAREFEFMRSFIRLFKEENVYVFNDLDPTGKTSRELPITSYAKNLFIWYSKTGIKTKINLSNLEIKNPQRIWGNNYFVDILAEKYISGIYMGNYMVDTVFNISFRISFEKNDDRLSYFKIAGITLSEDSIPNNSDGYLAENEYSNKESKVNNKINEIDQPTQNTKKDSTNRADSNTQALKIKSNTNHFLRDSGIIIDPRDGNEYKWLKIGDQIWLAENLAFLLEISTDKVESETLPRYYIYNFDGQGLSIAKKHKNYLNHGVLYNYPAAKKSCPDGWHLSKTKDWENLIKYLNSVTLINRKIICRKLGLNLIKQMKWKDISNSKDFIYSNKVFPGIRSYGGQYIYIGKRAYFWTDSEKGRNPKYYYFKKSSGKIHNSKFLSPLNGLSVRCLKDK